MAITGWEILGTSAISWQGFTLLHPIGTILTILLSLAITQNTKKAMIVSFPMTLALANIGLNPGLLAQTFTGFLFLFLGFSLTAIGGTITGAVASIRESLYVSPREQEQEKFEYEIREKRRQSQKKWNYQFDKKNKLQETLAEAEQKAREQASKLANKSLPDAIDFEIENYLKK